MTALKKPVERMLDVYEKGKPLVVRMAPEGLYLRRAGERRTVPGCYLLPWKTAYLRGALARKEEIKAERAAARKARRAR